MHLDRTNLSDEKQIETYEKSSGVQINWKRSAHLEEESAYLEYLSLLTASGTLPDLLIFPDLPKISEKNLLIDLDRYINGDYVYQHIPSVLQKAVSVSGTVSAVPLRYYLEGYFINHALFQKEKVSAPTFGSGFTRFFTSIKTLADKKPGFMILSRFSDIPYWYPVIQDSPSVWGAYRQNEFDMKHQSFLNGISYASQLRAAIYPDKKPEEIPQYSDDDLLKQWKKGNIACYYGSTQNINQISAVAFPLSYIGIPGNRIVLNADYIGITRSCSNREEAYSFLKWLSFDIKGVQKRYSHSNTFLAGSPPLTNNPNIQKIYLKNVSCNGIREAVELL